MNRFFAFVRKEFYHIVRDRRTLLILFGLPLVQVLLFGFALTNEIKNAKMALLDEDQSRHSFDLSSRLLASEYFQLVAVVRSKAALEQAFRAGEVKIAVVIPARFSRDWEHGRSATVQILADASEQNTAIALTNYATAIINDYSQATFPAQAPLRIDIQSRMVFNPELKGAFVFVPGVMALVLLLVSAMMTSITIAKEKETGTMEVLFVSPLNQAQIILGKVLPYLLLSFINGCIILTLGVTVLGMPLIGSLSLLLLETLLFITLALSIGIFISTIAPNQVVAMFASMMVLMMPTIFLSGFMFPIESMPKFLRLISNIIPAKYFINIIRGIMIMGLNGQQLLRDTLVLLGMTVFFQILSLRNLKTRLA